MTHESTVIGRAMQQIIQALQDLAHSPTVGHVIAFVTGGAGAATVLDVIPQRDIDKIYAIVGTFGLFCGAVLSLVLAWTHLQRWRLEKRRYEQERRPDAE